MCGRYTIRELERLRGIVDLLSLPDFEEFTDHVGRRGLFNITPANDCPVIRLDKNDRPALAMARWGLIPSWTKGAPKIQPINAKSETAATSGMFRQAMERRRCLVPADGFYEWQGKARPRQPYFIHMKDDSTFAFAGLWERWKPDEDSQSIDTFTILTTTPNQMMRPLHDRMPVILAQRDYARWLDRNNNAAKVKDLLKPCAPDEMEAWPVSQKVNSPKNDGPELIEPLEGK